MQQTYHITVGGGGVSGKWLWSSQEQTVQIQFFQQLHLLVVAQVDI